MSKYVKFTDERTGVEMGSFDQLADLNACRRKLLDLHLLGVYANGVGFGNLSVRDGVSRSFYITGSATGGLPELTPAGCVRVVEYDFAKNWLSYEGAAIPSSESLPHAAIYESDLSTSAVIHCHDLALWRALLDHVPTSSKVVTYGTPEMAYEIMRLFKGNRCAEPQDSSDGRSRRRHCGVGKNLQDAFEVLMRERSESAPCI